MACKSCGKKTSKASGAKTTTQKTQKLVIKDTNGKRLRLLK
jgi:hypothetical protein